MNFRFVHFAVLLGLGAITAGCQKSETTTQSEQGANNEMQAETQTVSLVYCGKCGHEKKGEECCKDGCQACETCGLHSGSKLCCKVDKEYAGKDMCGECGHVAGSEECCKDGCEICADCGLHQGSPLCCKLTDKQAEGTESDAVEAEEGTDGHG